jgi:hypothetical protein
MAMPNRLIYLAMFGSWALVSSNASAAEPKKKGEADVVFDNTGAARRKQEEQKKEQEEKAGANDVDTPFADTAPDPVAMRAQRWQPGFGFGARLGYAFPFGSSSDAKFSDQVNGMVFLWGDVGYWPIPYLFAGLYLSGGYVLPDCGAYDSCSGWDVRGGPEVIVRFMPFEKVTPWVGLGFGYEFLWLKYSADPLKLKISERGLEMLNIQAGVDVLSGGQFLGIFASYSLGKFSSGKIKTEVPGSGGETDLDNSDTHSWLAIGARGTFE